MEENIWAAAAVSIFRDQAARAAAYDAAAAAAGDPGCRAAGSLYGDVRDAGWEYAADSWESKRDGCYGLQRGDYIVYGAVCADGAGFDAGCGLGIVPINVTFCLSWYHFYMD